MSDLLPLAKSLRPLILQGAIEAGTWTPTAAGLTTPGTWTYVGGGQVGRYTRIGDRCLFDLLVRVNTVSGQAGDLTISLPLAASASATYVGGVGVKFLNSVTLLAGTRVVGGTVESGASYLRLTESPSAGTASYLPATAVVGGAWIVLWGEYEVAS